ncbi:MAG TPA: alpha/beta hydrolase [Planctomycetota bacterium]|nr:alpha/beta hydrolase [Planctomycetota bacterium]
MTMATTVEIAYGAHDRQRVTLHVPTAARAAPLLLFIHGGGFFLGDRSVLPDVIRDRALALGIAVAAVGYRLSTDAPYPAPFRDVARALQHLRHHAPTWGIDPTRVASCGGSAGAGLSSWLAYHADLADAASADPIARASTTLRAIAVWNAQCTYDPWWIRARISGDAWRHRAMQLLFAVPPERFDDPRAMRDFADSAALTHVSASAPPTFIWFFTADAPMTPDLDAEAGIHHPLLGRVMVERLCELGVPCELVLREAHPEVGDEAFRARFYARSVAFIARHLGIDPGAESVEAPVADDARSAALDARTR